MAKSESMAGFDLAWPMSPPLARVKLNFDVCLYVVFNREAVFASSEAALCNLCPVDLSESAEEPGRSFYGGTFRKVKRCGINPIKSNKQISPTTCPIPLMYRH